ncbi:MAG: cobalamin-dependent protein, partial [Candidatus Paceibacterota bacterium]
MTPSAFLSDQRVFVSLGALKVAAAMEEKGLRVEVLDLSGTVNYEEVLCEYLRETKPVTVGITATTPQMPAVAKIVAIIRHEQPTVRIILGGAHVTLINASARREKSPGRATVALRQLKDLVDVLVAGDGEKAIF